MPNYPHTGAPTAHTAAPARPRWTTLTAAVAALSIAAGLSAPPTAAAATTSTTPPPTPPVAAAIIVGGTSFPTVDTALMNQLWPVWSTNLGLTDSTPDLVSLTYPAQLWPFVGTDTLGSSVTTGVTNLLDLVNTTYAAGTGQRLIIWGISQGSLVLDQAQTLLATNPSAPPPDAITFVRVADPADAITGVLNHLPDKLFSALLHYPLAARTAPSDSQYDTVVVTNEYDGFADFPDRPGNPWPS